MQNPGNEVVKTKEILYRNPIQSKNIDYFLTNKLTLLSQTLNHGFG